MEPPLAKLWLLCLYQHDPLCAAGQRRNGSTGFLWVLSTCGPAPDTTYVM